MCQTKHFMFIVSFLAYNHLIREMLLYFLADEETEA